MKKLTSIIITSFLAFICVYGIANAYVVQNGDSMWKIAQNAGISLTELIRLNPQVNNPNIIYPGQEINTNSTLLGGSTSTSPTPAPNLYKNQTWTGVNTYTSSIISSGNNAWTGTNTFNGTTTSVGPNTGFALNPWFGDGSDGNVIVTSTLNLTRDMYFNNLTINSGATLYTKSWKIFVLGTLTNNGTINNDGSDAVKNTGGLGAPTTVSLSGGASGANALSSNATNYSGGGGGGGGIIYIMARHIVNNGIITAKGGNGATYGFVDKGYGEAHDGSAGNSVTNGLVLASGGAGQSITSAAGGAGGTITNLKTIDSKNIFSLRLFTDIISPFLLGGGAGGGGGGTSSNYQPWWASGGGGGGGTIYYIYTSKTETGTSTVSGGTAGTGATNGTNGAIFNTQISL